MTAAASGGTTTAEDLGRGSAPAEAPTEAAASEAWDRDRPPDRPRLPSLPRFTRPTRPAAETPPPPAGPGPDPERAADPAPPADRPGPGSDTPPTSGGTSSRASTEGRAGGRAPGDEWVDPKDLQAAVRQAADVAFVIAGQGFGSIERRARGLEAVDPKWVPTKDERELVLAPAGRIAKRHIQADRVALDTIDGCMIAAGVGAFAMRGFFGLDPLPADA